MLAVLGNALRTRAPVVACSWSSAPAWPALGMIKMRSARNAGPSAGRMTTGAWA